MACVAGGIAYAKTVFEQRNETSRMGVRTAMLSTMPHKIGLENNKQTTETVTTVLKTLGKCQ